MLRLSHHAEIMMKSLFSLFCLAVVVLLCACTSAPQVQTYVGGSSFVSGPTSVDDLRTRRPQFYMDDADSLPVWTQAAPAPNR